ncbi:helix-turn-helix domain-containing protein [Bacillus sp. OVS6]|nr:helix-turn-helix domain-containing protein [Bacillus sp. OVS6]
MMHQKLVNEQTDLQKMVFSLFEIFNQQRKVAKILGKSPSTISSHFKKGSGEELRMIFINLNIVLNSLQQKEFPDSHPALPKLQQSIRTYLQQHISEWYSKEEGKGNL